MTAATISSPVSEVMQRILTEGGISIAEAQSEFASIGGVRPDKSSVVRWCTRGCGGVKLECVRIGNRLVTSRQAITRFIHARTTASV